MQTFLLDQLVYFTFFQCVLMLSVYALSTQWRKTLNPYLIALVAVLLLGLSGRVAYMSGLFGKSYKLIGLSEFATYFFGATVYLYTKSSLRPDTMRKRDLLHYIPGVGYILVITFYYLAAPRELTRTRLESGEFFWAVVIFMGGGLLFNIGYWIAGYKIFSAFRKQASTEISYLVKTAFFHRFLMGILFCLVCWMIVYVVGIIDQSWIERSFRPFIWIGMALLILLISYYGLRSPEIFQVAKQLSVKKYASSKLTKVDLERLKDQLDQLMEEKKPFLNKELMKADLAAMLGIQNPEMARLLNERIGMNFFEYVNYYRIKEFVALANTEKAKKLTFFGLAQEAGFKSKTTFNSSFKKLMGSSPTEYFKQNIT
ncbi:MAG: helix-turn-helix domain-containing protein [Bacteroidota bacterium]